MKVAQLQAFVRSLVPPLQSAGATKKVWEDLERIAAALERFGDQELGAFADFLTRAEEYHRTGIVPASSGGRAAARSRPAKPPMLSVQDAAQKVMALYERAT